METAVHYSKTQNVFRIILGCLLVFTGTGHLSFLHDGYLSQVPGWVPVDADLVVSLSGVFEILLGLSLLFLTRYRIAVGWVAAIFFICIFPGNYAQYVNQDPAFGLDSDAARFTRLFLHPLLVIWPLWCCGVFSKKIR